MTHFADQDNNHASYNLFEKYVKLVNKKDLMIHCFASSSLNEYFENKCTHIRVGLKLLGITERSSFLHYALRLTSPILTIKKINKNFLQNSENNETIERVTNDQK
jgi:alanine racemase